MAHGLSCLQHVGSSRTRAQTHVPCIGRWILNHCATREVPPVQHLDDHPHPIPSPSSATLIILYTHTPTQPTLRVLQVDSVKVKTESTQPQQVRLLPKEQRLWTWQSGLQGPPSPGNSSSTLYSKAGSIEIAPKALLQPWSLPGRPLQTRGDRGGLKPLSSLLLPKSCSGTISGPVPAKETGHGVGICEALECGFLLSRSLHWRSS